MNAILARTIAVCAVALVAAACAETRYSAYDETRTGLANPFERSVEYEVSRMLYSDPPACVTVLPFEAEGEAARGALAVEESVARNLSLRVARVIGPRARDRWVRSLAVDLKNPRDRRAYADATRCAHFVHVRPWGGEAVFAVVWTQSRVGLEVTMTGVDDSAPLWRARHVATRSEGGLPLSPFSAVYNLLEVAQFKTDSDVPVSLIDDAARRIAATLPDTRMPGEDGGLGAPERAMKGVSRPAGGANIGDVADSKPYWR